MEELYNALVEQGKYTKSFEDFKVQFGEPEKTKLLYDALNSSEITLNLLKTLRINLDLLKKKIKSVLLPLQKSRYGSLQKSRTTFLALRILPKIFLMYRLKTM